MEDINDQKNVDIDHQKTNLENNDEKSCYNSIDEMVIINDSSTQFAETTAKSDSHKEPEVLSTKDAGLIHVKDTIADDTIPQVVINTYQPVPITGSDHDNSDDNDSKEKELVIAVADQLDRTNTSKTDHNVNDNKKSCLEKFIVHFGKYLYGVLVITTFVFIGILIYFNEPDERSLIKSGVVIALVCSIMILCGILMPAITLLLLKMWTKSTWFLVFFLIYFSLIVDVFAIAIYFKFPCCGYIKALQIPLIAYGVVKILLIHQSYKFAKCDGKNFLPNIISDYISIKFIQKNTKLYQMIYFYIAVLFIQMIIVSLGCMAFLIGNVLSVPLYIITLILFIWLINTFRHFGTFMTARMLSYYVSGEYKTMLDENPQLNVTKQAFFDTFNKFTTVVIGSLLIITTPITYFITNLMTGIRMVTATLVLCCLCVNKIDGDKDSCCFFISSIALLIANGIAALVRKISKWILRLTAKTILIEGGFINSTFINAIKKQTKTLKENKKTFGSDMIFLDNCMLSTITHLCILVSSIGALLAFMIQPNSAIICWVSGYAACRTMVEMIDVILQFFLIAWFVEPSILYENEILFAQFKYRIKEQMRTVYPNESDQVIQRRYELYIEAIQVTYLKKTTNPTQISNVRLNTAEMNAVQLQQTNLVQQHQSKIRNIQSNDIGTKDVQQRSLSSGWRQVISNDGRVYYQNDITHKTQWHNPIQRCTECENVREGKLYDRDKKFYCLQCFARGTGDAPCTRIMEMHGGLL